MKTEEQVLALLAVFVLLGVSLAVGGVQQPTSAGIAARAAVTAHAPLLDAAPAIDGKFDDAAWQKAGVIDGLKAAKSGVVQGERKTKILLGRDKDHLFISLDCGQPAKDGVIANCAVRDGDVWKDDCVEFFICPTGKPEEYWQVVVNAKGTIMDAYHEVPNQGVKARNLDIKAVAARDDNGWKVELAIPFKELGIEADKGGVRFNICRTIWSAGGNGKRTSEDHYLSVIEGWSSHVPGKFGYLTFLPPKAEDMDPRDAGAVADKLHPEMDESNRKEAKNPLALPKGNGLRIIMLGNSWTRPAVKTFPEIAKAAGFDGHRGRAFTPGSQRGHADPLFQDEKMREAIFPAIETGQWDAMTILSRWGDKPEHFTQWMEVCLKANPKMMFYIQTGWAYWVPSEPKGDPKVEPKANLAQMEAALAKQKAEYQANYEAIQAKYPGKVRMIPCGDAVMEMLRLYHAGKLPGFDCVNQSFGGKKGVFSDTGHLSEDSGMDYLLGYLFYGTIYRASPELIKDYAPPKLDPAIDKIMRHVAWQAIINSPFSGVTDKDGNGLADAP